MDGTIKSIPPAALDNVHRLKNRWVRSALWQHGLVRLVMNGWDSVIFLGDASYISTWISALALRATRRSHVIFWTIGWHRPETGIKKSIRLSFYRIAERLMTYGETAKRWGVDMGYPEARIFPIYNSVGKPTDSRADPAQLTSMERQLTAVGEDAVGTVIRLNENKRLDLLIEAAAYARTKLDRDIHVVLAGSGPAAEALVQQAQHLTVPLTMLGPIYSHEELEAFYKTCKVACIPTRAGLSVIQALSYGRPVITHDNPREQMPEAEAIQPGKNGDLYRQNDVEHLARTLVEWTTRVKADPREVAAACALAVEERWSAAPQAAAIISVLDGLERKK